MASVIFFRLCRPMLREVPGLGRSVNGAAIVVRSVKLVPQGMEPGEADTFWWPNTPVPQSVSIMLSTILPQRGAATSQNVPMPGACSIPMVHRAPPLCGGRLMLSGHEVHGPSA
jgi:hypothetical protein